MSHSLEAQQEEEGLLDQPPVNAGQLDDRPPISFEIHEEPVDNRVDDRKPITARFGPWANSATTTKGSHFLSIFAYSFLVYRIFGF